MKIRRNTHGTIAGIARSPRYNQDMIKHVLERRQGGGVVDDNSRMVFLIMNSIVNLKEHQNVDDDHDTFVERFHEDVTDRR